MFQTFATSEQPETRRLDYWNEVVGERFPGMTIDAESSINADWTQCWLGDLGVARARSQRATVSRWADTRPDEASHRILVHCQHSGFSSTEQRGRAAVLGRGDLTICRSDRPYRIDISDRNDMLVLDCDARVLGTALHDAAIAQVLPGSIPAVGMLHDFMASLFSRHWQVPPDIGEAEALRGVMVVLLRQALGRSTVASAPAGEDKRTRMLHFVEEHLFDPGLRTGMIAERLSVSVRSVQDVFAAMATTPTAFILGRRLSVAAERIRERRDFTSMTDLALDLGFCDAAHFARRFRQRFGTSPGEFARRCRDLH